MRYAVLAILLIFESECFGAAYRISSSDDSAMNFMMTDLRQARVIFVGEIHDQRDHHLLQLQVIKYLHSQGTPLAIGFEMFDLEFQPILDKWVQGKVSLQDFILHYNMGWNISWAEYDAIMLYARNHQIPMVALNAPPDLVKSVTYRGPPALTEEAAKRLPHGVTTAISPSYRDFMSQAFRTHRMPASMFDNFCAAQGLRNNTMAKRIAGYLESQPEHKMVVITGMGHAMRRAVPSTVSAAGVSTRIVMPDIGGLYEDGDNDADYFVEP